MTKRRRTGSGQDKTSGARAPVSGASMGKGRQPVPEKRKIWENKWFFPVLLLLLVLVVVGAVLESRKEPDSGDNRAEDIPTEGYAAVETVKIETNKGDILMEVYTEKTPVTAANFLGLVKQGFYDGLIWHRVEDWVVQTGDPQGTGYGGSSKTINLEIHPDLSNKTGFVGMARSEARDSASSQFYILKKDALSLDGDYAIFAKVIEGMDVVNQLAAGDKMTKATIVTAFPD